MQKLFILLLVGAFFTFLACDSLQNDEATISISNNLKVGLFE